MDLGSQWRNETQRPPPPGASLIRWMQLQDKKKKKRENLQHTPLQRQSGVFYLFRQRLGLCQVTLWGGNGDGRWGAGTRVVIVSHEWHASGREKEREGGEKAERK